MSLSAMPRNWSAVRRHGSAWYAKSASGWPRVESSQSSTASTRGSVGWKIMLSMRRSPWKMCVSSVAGMCVGSQSINRSMASIGSVSEARYCVVQRFSWRSKKPALRP